MGPCYCPHPKGRCSGATVRRRRDLASFILACAGQPQKSAPLIERAMQLILPVARSCGGPKTRDSVRSELAGQRGRHNFEEARACSGAAIRGRGRQGMIPCSSVGHRADVRRKRSKVADRRR